jgi:hypothetical protein
MDEKENSMKAQTVLAINIAVVLFGLSMALSHKPEPYESQEARPATQSAAQSRSEYVFAVFYEGGDAAKLTMWQTLEAVLAKRPGQARAVNIRVNDRAMKTVVDRYGVGRSPLPLVLAIAPNGAVTGAFAIEMTEQDVAGAFVSPGEADCMKVEQRRQVLSLLVSPSTAPWPTISTWHMLASRPATSNPAIVSRRCNCFKSSAAREEPSLLLDHCFFADTRSCLDENLLEPHPWPVRADARKLDAVCPECGAD